MSSNLTDRINGVLSSLAAKAPCLYATTANITLSGLGTRAGGPWASALTAGNRILVMNQTDATENGIYDADSSDWSRSKDFDGNRDVVQGTRVPVALGPTYELITPNPITIDTSNLDFNDTSVAYYGRTTGEIAAGVTPTNYSYAPGNVFRYGAAADDATDLYQPLTNSIAANANTIIEAGDYAIGDMVVITTGKSVELMQGVQIERKTSLSADTTPVIWLKESGATLIGANRNDSFITTQNAAPQGVVRLGLEDETETGRIVRNCRLEHLRINGSTGDGQTSGDPDVCVYSPCASGEINYYHTIGDLFLSDSNHGIWLHGESNGHNISRIFGESMGNASLDGVLLYFQGGSDCSVSQAFMSGNGASGAGAIMLKFSNLGASRSTHNHIVGLVGEMGVSGLLVESTDTTTSAPVSNYIEAVDNTGGNNVNDDFWNNNFAKISDFPSTKGGFRFPSTASLSSSAFVLDYYAETQSYAVNPAIDSATPGTGRSTTVNHAKWSRIGNICFVSLRVTMTTLGSGGSGNVRITNALPFVCISDSGNYLGGMEVPNYENLAANVRTIKAAAYPGTDDIAIYITTGDAATNTQMDFATYVQATTQFYVTGFYIVA